MPNPDDSRPPHLVDKSAHYPKADGTATWKSGVMADSRGSGELEGSTLGSSSRDGERSGRGRGRGQRRTHSAGGFLLDSPLMPRSKALKTTSHRPRRSEPPRAEKRDAPEPEIAVPKKRSKFPWSRHRHRHSGGALQPETVTPSSSSAAPEGASNASDGHQLDEPGEPSVDGGSDHAAGDLDKDSMQIVNLALNLSESRKRTSFGRSVPTQIPGDKLAYGHHHTGTVGHHPLQSRRPLLSTFTPPDSKQPDAHEHGPGENPTTLDLLPNSNDDGDLPLEVSDNTLARVEKARQHFELFAEYLRLLPSLPSLRSGLAESRTHTPVADDHQPSIREYNPLQAIRNRKVRFHEKCPIDAEAEGWTDVGKVHEWVDDVEEQSGHQTHSNVSCLRLPSFESEARHGHTGEPHDPDLLTATPPSSLRHVSRGSGSMPHRPRVDWIISPAELLSDAAWVEEGRNKGKIVDKDGNSIYPDSAELVPGDVRLDAPRAQDGHRMSEAQSIDQRISAPQSHRAMTPEAESVKRGHHHRRLSSQPSAPHGSSGSTKHTGLNQDKPPVRSSSSSSQSANYSRRHSRTRYDSEGVSERHAPGFINPQISRIKRSEDPDGYTKSTSSQVSGYSPHPPTEETTRTKPHERMGSLSSGASISGSYSPRMSLEGAESTAGESPTRVGYFPSIAVNLSPPSSRSPSPSRKPFSRIRGPLHERSKSGHKEHARDYSGDNLCPKPIRPHESPAPPAASETRGRLEPSPIPDQVSASYQESPSPNDSPVTYDSRAHKEPSSPQESKLRGIFKGPGKIAGKVGNEVFRVGDRILKKEAPPHSHKSSVAASLGSGGEKDDDTAETKSERASAQKPSMRRFPTFSEESSRVSHRASGKLREKRSSPSLPTFTSSREDEASGLSSHRLPERDLAARAQDTKSPLRHITSAPVTEPDKLRSNVSEVSGEDDIHTDATHVSSPKKRHQIRDSHVPYGLIRPPVTGLAQAKASPSPERRPPRLSEASRTWSISNRSLSALADSGIPEKREVERTRALLLSSGIKAREIARRAETIRDPPPEFLKSSVGPNEPVPQVTRLREFDVAAQNLLRRFEKSQCLLQEHMDRFPAATSSPLRSQLQGLDATVNDSLSPRVRAIGAEAERLSSQLNTTSTLAVKQLSDTLDRGMRKRHRRLRLARRAGFVVLEWALVGILWWVWLIVMIFKLLRGISRGAMSGVRWVLWL